MRDDYDEKELENALVNQITQFLLELGTGFSYVGRQVHLQVGEREFYIDLLFYHIKLHCYVVVELKTKRFEPEYVGKLNFYVTAVNKQLTGNGDNPAIGLIICKDKDNVVAEYSLEEVSQPIGITGYELSNALSKEYQHSLPTIETLESEVAILHYHKQRYFLILFSSPAILLLSSDPRSVPLSFLRHRNGRNSMSCLYIQTYCWPDCILI